MISCANSWTSVAKFSAGGIPGSRVIFHPQKCLEPEQYLRRSRARCLVGSRIARGVPDTVEARLARVQGPEARGLPSGRNQKLSNGESPAERRWRFVFLVQKAAFLNHRPEDVDTSFSLTYGTSQLFLGVEAGNQNGKVTSRTGKSMTKSNCDLFGIEGLDGTIQRFGGDTKLGDVRQSCA
jgi:hypothetical protein